MDNINKKYQNNPITQAKKLTKFYYVWTEDTGQAGRPIDNLDDARTLARTLANIQNKPARIEITKENGAPIETMEIKPGPMYGPEPQPAPKIYQDKCQQCGDKFIGSDRWYNPRVSEKLFCSEYCLIKYDRAHNRAIKSNQIAATPPEQDPIQTQTKPQPVPDPETETTPATCSQCSAPIDRDTYTDDENPGAVYCSMECWINATGDADEETADEQEPTEPAQEAPQAPEPDYIDLDDLTAYLTGASAPAATQTRTRTQAPPRQEKKTEPKPAPDPKPAAPRQPIPADADTWTRAMIETANHLPEYKFTPQYTRDGGEIVEMRGYFEHTESDFRIWAAGDQWRNKGMTNFNPDLEYKPDGFEETKRIRDFGPRGEYPNININHSRPPADIAADLQRRMIEPGRAYYEKALAAAKEYYKRVNEQWAHAEKMQQDHPGAYLKFYTWKSGRENAGTPELYAHHTNIRDLKIYSDLRGEIRLENLTPEQLNLILDIIEELPNRHPNAGK